MPHVIRFHADARRVRVEIPSLGISLEEEAAAAVLYRRPSRGSSPTCVLAVGRDALRMTESVRMDRSLATTEEDRRARVVPLEQAAWWNDGRLVERGAHVDPAQLGEILIVRPFARETFSVPLCGAILRYMDFMATRQAGGVFRRLYFRRLLWWAPRVELSLEAVPDDDVSHDALARELRPYFGASATLGGAPLRVRHPRGLADLRWIHLGRLAAILAAGALPVALRPGLWLSGVRVTVLGAVVVFWLVCWYRKFRYD
ncbi:hypothetical protein [Sorangium sp. So ce131]|uniref:hypothetical protein n=1 Tax=Sorangium sp. So ce131 TaxID=3133282 RepID=UPI003F621EAD